MVHGGVRLQERKVWTLCSNEEAAEFSLDVPDTPFILMVDRGDCTFASKVGSPVPWPGHTCRLVQEL